MASNENEFPTISDLCAKLSELVEQGFGDLPFQVVVAPDSTIQALARSCPNHQGEKPALMIEFPINDSMKPFGVSFISTDRLTGGGGMKSIRQQ
jgi:hypothetical protein